MDVGCGVLPRAAATAASKTACRDDGPPGGPGMLEAECGALLGLEGG